MRGRTLSVRRRAPYVADESIPACDLSLAHKQGISAQRSGTANQGGRRVVGSADTHQSCRAGRSQISRISDQRRIRGL